MQRIVCLLAYQPVGLHTHGNIRRLDTDDDVMEILLLQHPHLVHGALHDTFRSHSAVLLHQIFLQRSAVDADPDGHMIMLCRIHHLLQVLRTADISGVDPDLVRPMLHGTDGKSVIKMDIRNDRDMDPFPDLIESIRCRFRIRRAPDDLTSRLLQCKDLGHRSLHVTGLRICHGLDRDGIFSSDRNIPYLNHSGLMPFHHTLPLLL